MNKLICLGNLTKDNELKYLPNGTAVLNNSIATTKKLKDKEENCFINFQLFGKAGEIFNQYTNKGSKVYLEGMLQQKTWEKDGKKHSQYVLNVEEFKFLDCKKQQQTYTKQVVEDDEEILF